MPRNSSRITIIFAGLAFLLPLLVYIYTLCPTVPVGDGGELICAAHDVGIAHPTGYPLFCLMGRVFSLSLPLDNVARRLNLMSAVFASLAAVAVFFLAGELFRPVRSTGSRTGSRAGSWAGSTGGPGLLLTTALVFAFSRTLWAHAVQTEVYALHAFLVAAVLLTVIRWRRTGDARLAYLGAFLFGLSLTNHTSAVIVAAPLLFVLARGRADRHLRRHLPGLVLFFLLGISLYLYLPWRSALNPPNDWGDPESLRHLWDHLTARLYRRHFVLAVPAAVVRNLRHYVSLLAGQFGPVVFLAGALGAVWQARRQPGLFTVLSLTWAANLLLAASYDITDIDAYYLPAHMVMSLWIGFGVYAAIGRMASQLGSAGFRLLLSIVLLALVGTPLAANFSRVSQRGQTIARDYGLNILDTAEPDAILLSFSDSEHFPILYLHQAERVRPDISILSLTSTETQLRRLFGSVEGLSGVSREHLLRLAVQKSSRPVNITKEHMSPQNDVIQAAGFSLQPFGLVYRLGEELSGAKEEGPPWSAYRLETFEHLSRFSDYRALRMVANHFLSWGEDLLAGGDSLAALEKFSSAQVAIQGHGPSILHSEMAVFFRRIGWLPGARQEYLRALSGSWKSLRDESYIHGNYANLLAEQGDIVGAGREWQRALQIWSGNREAQFNLARFKADRYLRQERFGAAAEEYERMLLIDPDNPAVCFNLGTIYAHRLNAPERAGEYFQRCLDIDPAGSAAAAAREELERLRSGSR